MEKRVIKVHIKGQKRMGRTNWNKVRGQSNSPLIDNESPEIVFKKPCSKPVKNS